MEEIRIKEVINILKRYEYSTKLELSEGTSNDACDSITVNDFMDMKDLAIAALEKTIGIEPISKTGRFIGHHLCPICNRMYWKGELVPNYCNSCGQKFKLD